MPKISIIVPVYNVEKYLDRCINSILKQDFKEFELLLIDDGSTDNSGKKCDEYKLKDNRVRVIHKVNGGLSDARNLGLDLAEGDYVGFVDSDDWIDEKMYSILYQLAIEYNADISTCGIKEWKDNNNNDNDNDNNNKKIFTIKELSGPEAIYSLYHNELSGYSACNKLYKKFLFDNIRFPKGRIFEDASIIYKLYHLSNKIVYKDYKLYNYIKRNESITTKKVSNKRLDIVLMFDELIPFIKNNYSYMVSYIESMYFNSLRNIIVDIINENTFFEKQEIIENVSNIVRENLKVIIKNKNIEIKHKILGVIIGYYPKSLFKLYALRRR